MECFVLLVLEFIKRVFKNHISTPQGPAKLILALCELKSVIIVRTEDAVRLSTSYSASLAQSVERQTLNLKVAGSTPAWG
jgi:hypothetical protein